MAIEDDLGDVPEVESLAKKAGGSFAWALLSFVLLQVGSYATYWIASKSLGSEQLGVVASALTLVFWIDILLDLGMGAAVIYEQEKGQSRRIDVAFTVNIMVATLVASTILLAAPAVDSFFQIGNVPMLRLLAVVVMAKGLTQIPDSLLKRDLDFRKRAASDFTRSIVRFVVAVSLLQAGVGPIAMIIGVMVAEVCALFVTWWLVKFTPRIAFDWPIARNMLNFGLSMFGLRLAGMLWLNGDYLVVQSHYGARSTQFGNYYTAFRLPELVLGSAYNIFSNVIFPTYSAARQIGMDKLRQASLKSLRLLCLFGFTAGIGMSLVARDFILWSFGDSFEGAIMPMQLLGIGGGFAAVGFASGDLYAALGRPRLGLYFNLAGAPILIGGFFLFVSRGIVAVAIVHIAVIIPYSAFRIEVANRLLGTTWAQSLAALRPALVSVIGLLAFGLPVRLLTDPGVDPSGAGLFLSMVAIAAAGTIGAGLGVRIGDAGAYRELKGFGEKALAKVR